MGDRERWDADSSDKKNEAMIHIRELGTSTETVDFTGLFTDALTTSGNFDVSKIRRLTFGKLLQALPTPAFLIDQTSRILFANESCKKISRDYEKVVGSPFSSLFPYPPTVESVKSLIQDVFSNRKPRAAKNLLKIGEGKIWGRMTFRSIRLEGRMVVLCLVEDLTSEKTRLIQSVRYRKRLSEANKRLKQEISLSRKKEQEALLAKERWQQTFDAVPDLIMILNTRHRIVQLNKAMADRLGMGVEEAFGRRCYEVVHGENVPPSFCPHAKLIADHMPHAAEICETRMDGVFDITVCPLFNEDGGLIGSVHVARDITLRKNMEAVLRENEERLELALTGADLGLWDWNIQTGEVLLNNRAAEIFGYAFDEIHPRFDFLRKRIHPDDAPAVTDALNAHFEGFTSLYETEHRILTKSGEWKWVLDRGKVVERNHDGKPLRAVGTYLDVTDHKRTEDLLVQTEKFRAIADLAAGVAHNFNNLLQIILGNAGLAVKNLEASDISGMKNYLEQIIRSSRLGAETVRRLNNFAKVHRNGEDAVETVFDLSELVRQAIEMTSSWWKTTYEKRGIKIHLRKKLADDCLIKGDRNQIFEVFINLLKNAGEAVSEGGGIWVTTEVRENRVIAKIRDSGIGIPARDIDRIFAPFFTTKSQTGTGLGLAASRGIVESHAGSIVVESAEGNGTTFTISLPRTREVPEPVKSADEPSVGMQLTILAIDDQKDTLSLLQDGLSMYGHTVFTAVSGQEGAEIFQKNPVDLIICDLDMPGMNGWEVGKTIKEICAEKGLNKPAIVILTGWGDQSSAGDRMAEFGIDTLVGKPVDFATLLGVIASLEKSGKVI